MDAVTQSSLSQEMQDLLKPYYEQKAKLENQIAAFTEGLKTAHDDLVDLNIKYKPYLKFMNMPNTKRGEIQNTIYNYVKEHEGLTRPVIIKALMPVFNKDYARVYKYLITVWEKGWIEERENRFYALEQTKQKRSFNGAIKTIVLETLGEYEGTASIKDVSALIKNYTIVQVRSAMHQLVIDGKVEVVKSDSNYKYTRYKVKK